MYNLSMRKRGKQGTPDLNETAFRVISEATGDIPFDERLHVPGDNPVGREGGLIGGKARANTLSAEERSAIAKRAARIRWNQGG